MFREDQKEFGLAPNSSVIAQVGAMTDFIEHHLQS
jgi:hypothetical protein